MKNIMQNRFQSIVIGVIGLLMMFLVTACAGVTGTNATNTGGNTITGAVVSVNTAQHSAILNVNGQQVTVSGLTDQQVTTLQAQAGKTYTIQVIQGSGNSYTINPNSTPELNETNTPQANQTERPNATETTNPTEPQNSLEQGNISFSGKVQSVDNNRIVVSMPSGQTLSMSINSLTDLSDFNGVLPSTGTLVKVKATANTNGSFTASSVKPGTPGDLDQNVVDYEGVTTSAVGSDRVLHFKVATKSYSFVIGSTSDLSDFNNNAQSIGNNLQVKVEVQFNGATGTVIKAANSNS
ncbi:MAG: DUF5666 domain-containing protein [Ktedonobacteraceae bacterium]